MAWNILLIILSLSSSYVLCEIKRDKQSKRCSTELICGEGSEVLPVVLRGLPGLEGPQGSTGESGPMGPPGLSGPPGRDGFTERPSSFYAELQRLFITKNHDSILQPWTLSDSFNTPDVSNYFSHETGIFTVPKSGLYQFFLTIAVSRAKASVYITKNGQRMCTLWLESVIMVDNKTVAWNWSSSSLDCLIYCQINDQISAVAAYRSNENFNSEIYGYSYSTFSGYMLFNIQ